MVEQNNLLDTLFRMQSKFIAEENSNTVFDSLLNEILLITKSEYGFISDIKHTETGEPYLKTRAITNIAWDAATQKFYEEEN